MDHKLEAITQHPYRHHFTFGGPVLGYALFIFLLSCLSSFPETVPSFYGFDKIVHLGEYFTLGFLIYRWFSSMCLYRKQTISLLMTILVGTIYGILDEWHQSFVPGRDASLWDALFDAVGVAAGAVTYQRIRQRYLQ